MGEEKTDATSLSWMHSLNLRTPAWQLLQIWSMDTLQLSPHTTALTFAARSCNVEAQVLLTPWNLNWDFMNLCNRRRRSSSSP